MLPHDNLKIHIPPWDKPFFHISTDYDRHVELTGMHLKYF